MNRLAEHLISYLLDEAVFPVQQLDKAERVLGLPKQTIIDTVEQFDPTSTKDYSVWILKQWMFKNIILPEDGHRVLTTLTHYDQNKRKANSRLERDINRYRTIHDLENALEEEIPALKTTSVEVGQQVKNLPGVTVVKQGPPDLVVLKVEDPDSLATLGEGTKWCTRRSFPDCQAESYIKDYGHIYVVLKQGKPFVQYTPDYGQIKNVGDNNFTNQQVLRQILVPPEKPTAKSVYVYCRILGKRWPQGEPIVAKDPEYAVKYAKLFFVGKRWPEAEPVIAKSAKWSLEYALNSRQRFPAGEASILKSNDLYYMIRYAREVIGGRWPEAEPAIAQNLDWFLEYASSIKQRFPALEKVILNSKKTDLMIRYANDVIGGRWPEAETVIVKDAKAYVDYASRIKRRFPAGEETILSSKNAGLMVRYAKEVIGDGWPEAEPIIAKDPNASYRYAVEVLKGRFIKGEPAIRQNWSLWNKYQRYLDLI